MNQIDIHFVITKDLDIHGYARCALNSLLEYFYRLFNMSTLPRVPQKGQTFQLSSKMILQLLSEEESLESGWYCSTVSPTGRGSRFQHVIMKFDIQCTVLTDHQEASG